MPKHARVVRTKNTRLAIHGIQKKYSVDTYIDLGGPGGIIQRIRSASNDTAEQLLQRFGFDEGIVRDDR